MKLTSWYSGDQKPIRVGVYERDYDDLLSPYPFYCWFNGKYFSINRQRINECSPFHRISMAQNLPWRGVTK